jgi:hypothetical protein
LFKFLLFWMSAKLMVVAMIFTTANPLSGYYGLRR